VSTNISRVLAGPGGASRLAATARRVDSGRIVAFGGPSRLTAAFVAADTSVAAAAGACRHPPGSRDHPDNVRGHRAGHSTCQSPPRSAAAL